VSKVTWLEVKPRLVTLMVPNVFIRYTHITHTLAHTMHSYVGSGTAPSKVPLPRRHLDPHEWFLGPI